MSHKRIPKRKAAIAAGGVVALGAAAILLPNANASQDGSSSNGAAAAPKTLKASDASDLASQLQELLGDAFAGSYYDTDQQQLVVNVISGDNNNVIVQAKKAYAKIREVDNSLTELAAGAATLKADATIPGTSWAVDPRTNKILVTADSTVTGAKWDQLESTVDTLGSGMATIKKSAGDLQDLPLRRRRHLRRRRPLLGRVQRHRGRRQPGLPDRRSLRCRGGPVVGRAGRPADRHRRPGHLPRRR